MPPPGPDCSSYYERLHSACGEVLRTSFSGEYGALLGSSHDAIVDLESWVQVLPVEEDRAVIRRVVQEYEMGLLTLTQGFYRHAFGALRYCLETTLGLVYLSTNEMNLRLWLAGEYDLSWEAIVDAARGVFSTPFSHAFCPSLAEEMPHYAAMAKKVYRECSEFVHGNPVASRSLPVEITFSDTLFRAWHAHASTIRLLQHYALAARFLAFLAAVQRRHIEPVLEDVLGHLPQVRAALEDNR